MSDRADAAIVEVEKKDDSASLEASVADNMKEENELIPESPAVSITETVSHAPKTQPHGPPSTQKESAELEELKPPHTPQIESEAEAVKETQTSEETEEESQQKGQEEQPVETIEKLSVAIQETTREPESDAVVVKETANYEAGPTETEKPESVAIEVEENPSETEKKGEEKQLMMVISETSAQITEKPGEIVEVHPPKEKKTIEHLEVAKEVKEQSRDVEIKQQAVGEFAESEGTSEIPWKEEEETSLMGPNAQVSLEKKAQATNEAEPSPGIAENVAEEDGKRESSCTHNLENPEQVSVNQEAKTDLQEEKEVSAPPCVEGKMAANDDKKEAEARDVGEGLSREADKATAQEPAKLGSEKDDEAAVDNKKEGHAETKVDEIAPAVSEPVRETLASKLKEKEENSITGVVGSDIPKETQAKPPQKQSNNILWKVKQSLVKAKKAITGKSPTSKTLSSEGKGDIQVK